MHTSEKTRNIIFVGMMTAVMAILSIIRIPLPSGVPITLQTFAVALCGFIFSWKLAMSVLAVYLLLGGIGVPIFSGMTGGLGVILGLTGGFLIGFIPMALFCGFGSDSPHIWESASLGIIGLIICHTFGVLQFAYLTGRTPIQSFFLVSLPYLIKDILSVLGAILSAIPIKKAIKRTAAS